MAALRALVAFVLAVTCCTGQKPISFGEDLDKPRRRNDSCVDSSGLRPVDGVCRSLQECPTAMKAYTSTNATLPSTCSFEGVTRIVCCVGDGPVTTSLNAVDISSPDLDFECGQRPPIPISARHERSVPDNNTFPGDNTVPDYDYLYPISTEEAVGGFISYDNSWPWAALFGWSMPDGSTRWRCGGALINRRWVVTAAHCFDKGDPQIVRLGEHNYSSPDGPFRQDFKIRQYHRYPEYSLRAAYHDLALVELDRPAELKPQVAPVCLPWGSESLTSLPGWSVKLTGWGATEYAGDLSPVLQEVNLSVFPARTCNSSYSNLPSFELEFPRGITAADFVCAGDGSGGKDACGGDSGSPLTYYSFNREYVLSGVVAKGYGCGLVDYPGLYTPLHIGEYLNWIKTTAFT